MTDHNIPTELHEEAIIVMENVEDIVEYICREYKMSGEKVWVMIQGLAEAKVNQFPVEED
tara:strand:- start:145 stop:324 length:180 start_codon:yes stop_codon:yes gene_type:complete